MYPNKMARIHVLSIEETIGHSAMMAVFDAVGIPHTFYPPANDFAKGFDFAYYGAIGIALEKMYGTRGERGLMLHAGRAAFDDGLAQYGAITGTSGLALKAIPTMAKLRVGLKAIADVFNKFSDQITTVAEEDDKFIYSIKHCPACWGRTSQRPVCFTTVGLLQEAIKWVSGGQLFNIVEVACSAMESDACVYHISKEPSGKPAA
jgi:predicted hydrocarbon binding protein